jgi:hypothetical protein
MPTGLQITALGSLALGPPKLSRSLRAPRDPMYGRSTVGWHTAAQVDVSGFAVLVADDSTRPNRGLGVGSLNNPNTPGADLHATLAARVRGVIPTHEDGGDARWE